MDLLDDESLLDLGPVKRSRANKALEDWQPLETPQPEHQPKAGGDCALCGQRPGKRACEGCRRWVCSTDMWTMFGLCVECATEERVGQWKAEKRVSGANWLGEQP
jgi:hypothetical protein